MKRRIGLVSSGGMVITKLWLASSVLAAGSFDATTSTDLSDPIKAYGKLGTLFSVLFTILLIAGGITAIGFFIFGAIQYGTAGSGDGAAKARRTMTAAVVGLILMGLVFAFIHFYNTILPAAPTS